MAIVLQKVCDNFQLHSDPVEGATVRVSVDGVERELELCVQCRERLLAGIEELLEFRGRRPEVTKSLTGPRQQRSRSCKWCDFTCAAGSAMTAHVDAEHPDKAKNATIQCKLCKHEPFRTMSALGRHSSTAHNVPAAQAVAA